MATNFAFLYHYLVCYFIVVASMVKVLLVVGGNPSINWYQVFADAKLHDEEEIRVEMAHWDGIKCFNDK